MSLRQLLKTDSYFLVRFEEDQEYQVRRRGLILNQGEVKILHVFIIITLFHITHYDNVSMNNENQAINFFFIFF